MQHSNNQVKPGMISYDRGSQDRKALQVIYPQSLHLDLPWDPAYLPIRVESRVTYPSTA
jgi:hypothetical protein